MRSRARCFGSNSRAICLEMEASVARVPIDDQIRKLIKVAEDAGWTVTVTRNQRLSWANPDGTHAIVTGTKGVGHALERIKGDLRRNGLALPEEAARANKQIVVQEPVEVELEIEPVTPEQALEVLMEFITSEREPQDVSHLHNQIQDLTDKNTQMMKDQTKLRDQVTNQAEMLRKIGEAFNQPSWEVLPTIARVIGIQVG